MKAALVTEFGEPLEFAEVSVDEPARHEVLVRVAASGICRTDRSVQMGLLPLAAPLLIGHEIAGVVAAIGEDVTDFAVGDHVVACAASSCGSCRWCLRGLTHLCEHKPLDRAADARPRLSCDGRAVATYFGLGGFAEQVLVSVRSLVRIPPEVPLDLAAILGCCVITGVGAVVNTAQVKAGESVVVLGIGGVGASAVQAAVISGAWPVVAIDLKESKLALAREMGASHVINASQDGAIEQLREVLPKGADHVIDVVGTAQTLAQGLDMLDVRGTLTVVGLGAGNGAFEVPVRRVLLDELTIRGSRIGSANFRLDIPMLCDWYLGGRLDLERLVGNRVRLEEVNTVLDGVDHLDGARTVITFDEN